MQQRTLLAAVLLAPFFVDGQDFTFERVLLSEEQVPGMPDGVMFDFFSPFVHLDASDNLTLSIRLDGPGVTGENDLAVFRRSAAGQFDLLLREDDTVPDRPDLRTDRFRSYSANDAGQVAVYTLVSDTAGQSAGAAVITQTSGAGLALSIPPGASADGLPAGFVLESLVQNFWSLSDAGTILFTGIAADPNVFGDRRVIGEAAADGSSLSIIAMDDMQVPGLPSGVAYQNPFAYGNPAGDVVISTALAGPAPLVDSSNDHALLRRDPGGQLQPILRKGDAIPMPDGGSALVTDINDFVGPRLDTDGAVTGYVSISRSGTIDEAIASDAAGGGFEVIAYEGQPVPSLGPYAIIERFISRPEFTANGTVAFIARVPGLDVLFSARSGEPLEPILTAQDPIPGLGSSIDPRSIESVVYNGGTTVHLLAESTSNFEPYDVLVRIDEDGQLRLVFSGAEPFNASTDPMNPDFREVFSAFYDAGNQNGAAVLGIEFMDFSNGIFLATPVRPCRADTNGDGLVTPADFSAWITAFNTQSPACDQNNDGLCTPADFSAWILNFNNGC